MANTPRSYLVETLKKTSTEIGFISNIFHINIKRINYRKGQGQSMKINLFLKEVSRKAQLDMGALETEQTSTET